LAVGKACFRRDWIVAQNVLFFKDRRGSPYGWEGYQFGSAHPAGISGLLSDGSVRMISYQIDATIFNRLGDRQDGTVVTLD